MRIAGESSEREIPDLRKVDPVIGRLDATRHSSAPLLGLIIGQLQEPALDRCPVRHRGGKVRGRGGNAGGKNAITQLRARAIAGSRGKRADLIRQLVSWHGQDRDVAIIVLLSSRLRQLAGEASRARDHLFGPHQVLHRALRGNPRTTRHRPPRAVHDIEGELKCFGRLHRKSEVVIPRVGLKANRSPRRVEHPVENLGAARSCVSHCL